MGTETSVGEGEELVVAGFKEGEEDSAGWVCDGLRAEG